MFPSVFFIPFLYLPSCRLRAFSYRLFLPKSASFGRKFLLYKDNDFFANPPFPVDSFGSASFEIHLPANNERILSFFISRP